MMAAVEQEVEEPLFDLETAPMPAWFKAYDEAERLSIIATFDRLFGGEDWLLLPIAERVGSKEQCKELYEWLFFGGQVSVERSLKAGGRFLCNIPPLKADHLRPVQVNFHPPRG